MGCGTSCASETHAKGILGETYLPEAVLVTDRAGTFRPALTYIAPTMEPRAAERDYVERIALPAEHCCFPAWYLEKIRSFGRQDSAPT